MKDVTLSAEDISRFREYHLPSERGRDGATWLVCGADLDEWPCGAARLLATIDALQASLTVERTLNSAVHDKLVAIIEREGWEDPKGRGR